MLQLNPNIYAGRAKVERTVKSIVHTALNGQGFVRKYCLDNKLFTEFCPKMVAAAVEYRRQGLCLNLMKLLIESAKEKGLDKIQLKATEDG